MQSGNGARGCKPVLQQSENIFNMNYEDGSFPSCFNARLLDFN